MSFSTDMARLRKLTTTELHARREAITSDPALRMPKSSVYLYVPKARRKLDLIARAISERIGGAE